MEFKIGDKIKAHQYDNELYDIEFVTITDINKENEMYHWEAPRWGGVIHSGYRFSESEKWIPKDELRDIKLEKLFTDINNFSEDGKK